MCIIYRTISFFSGVNKRGTSYGIYVLGEYLVALKKHSHFRLSFFPDTDDKNFCLALPNDITHFVVRI